MHKSMGMPVDAAASPVVKMPSGLMLLIESWTMSMLMQTMGLHHALYILKVEPIAAAEGGLSLSEIRRLYKNPATWEA